MRRIGVSAFQECEPLLILANPAAGKSGENSLVPASILRIGYPV